MAKFQLFMHPLICGKTLWEAGPLAQQQPVSNSGTLTTTVTLPLVTFLDLEDGQNPPLNNTQEHLHSVEEVLITTIILDSIR